jgi:hypothetical protein
MCVRKDKKMLQQISNQHLPVFFEKGLLSNKLGYPTIQRTTTDKFPDNAVTVRTAAIRDGYNASVTLYHNSSGGRLCVTVGTWNDQDGLSFNGCLHMDDLDGIVAIIKEIRENLNKLKPETDQLD